MNHVSKNMTFARGKRPVLLAIVIAVGAVVIPWWPLAAVAVLIAALAGRYALALGLGIFFDVLYGAPPVFLHFLQFPFTLGAVLFSVLRHVSMRYVRRGRGEYL